MSFEYGNDAGLLTNPEGRRSGDDRRAQDRRRRAKGLFEFRARREGLEADRRRRNRREESSRRLLLSFWRRGSS